ncbi:MAG: type II secretion system F family protein [Armatimonadetes bacterium]|nr:type II secretion system F family protein [Armatimonadota bacterium]
MELLLLGTVLLWMATVVWSLYRFWTTASQVPEARVRRALQAEEEVEVPPRSRPLGRFSSLDEEWEKQERQASQPLLPTVSRFLEGRKWMTALAVQLQRARLKVEPTTLLVTVIFGSVILFTLTAILLSIYDPVSGIFSRVLFAGAVAASVPLGFFFYLRIAQRQFLRSIDLVLPDTLALMANILRSGIGFQQALEIASQEGLSPLREELGQVFREMSVGATMEEALEKLLQRVPSQELGLVVTAVLVQREVGGSLAKIFETASNTIRARLRLNDEMKALTAPGRFSAAFLTALPIFVVAAVNFVTYQMGGDAWSTPMLRHPLGLWAIALSLLLLGGGAYWISLVLKVEG